MNKRQREILQTLMQLSNDLGGDLDGTSTTERKYRDRQRALMNVYRVLLAVLSDHPDNDQREYEYELAEEAIAKMQELKDKKYPDRNGNF